MSVRPLWTVEAMAQAMRADARGRAARDPCPASRSTPARVAAGRGILRDQRRQPRRPRLRRRRARRRRRRSRWWPRTSATALPRTRRCSWSPMCSKALRDLARAARARSQRQDRRRHRLGRQDRHQGGAAAGARRGGRDPRLGRLLQQSLGRAAVAGALPAERRVCRVRDRHEPCRRDRAARPPGASACRDHHHDRAGASGILRFGRGDRRRQGGDLPRARAGRRGADQPRQSRNSRGSQRSAQSAGVERIVSFGEHAERRCEAAQVRRCSRLLDGAGAHSRHATSTYKLGAPGRHMVLNSLAVLAAVALAGADLALAALRARRFEPARGRGSRVALDAAGRHARC